MKQIMMRQVIAVIDDRTTMVCLRAAGQTALVDEPFDVLTGEIMDPPFHWGCRSVVAPWVPGMINDQKERANAEIRKRPRSERRFGPDGYEGKIPGVPKPPPEPPFVLPDEVADWFGPGRNPWVLRVGREDEDALRKMFLKVMDPDAEMTADEARALLRQMGALREKYEKGYSFAEDADAAALFRLIGQSDKPMETIDEIALAIRNMPSPYLDRNEAMSAIGKIMDNRRDYIAGGPVQAEIAEIVERWTGSMSQIEQVRKDIAAGKYPLFRAALAAAPEDHPTLYRGMFANNAEMSRWIQEAKPGVSIDLGDIASFTSNSTHAGSFIRGAAADTILFEVDNGPALPISAIANTPGELEWLMGGRLRITEIVSRRSEYDDEIGVDIVNVVVKAKWVK